MEGWKRFMLSALFLWCAEVAASSYILLKDNSTGRDLYYAMKHVISDDDMNVVALNGWSYARGYIDSSMQSTAFAKSSITGKRCDFPEKVTVDQVARVVIRYLDDNPDQWDISPPFALFFFATHGMLICSS